MALRFGRSSKSSSSSSSSSSNQYTYNPVAQGDTCSICLEEYDNDKRFSLCSNFHRFHYKCLEEWKDKNGNTCPLCRCVINKIMEEDGRTDEEIRIEKENEERIKKERKEKKENDERIKKEKLERDRKECEDKRNHIINTDPRIEKINHDSIQCYSCRRIIKDRIIKITTQEYFYINFSTGLHGSRPINYREVWNMSIPKNISFEGLCKSCVANYDCLSSLCNGMPLNLYVESSIFKREFPTHWNELIINDGYHCVNCPIDLVDESIKNIQYTKWSDRYNKLIKNYDPITMMSVGRAGQI